MRILNKLCIKIFAQKDIIKKIFIEKDINKRRLEKVINKKIFIERY